MKKSISIIAVCFLFAGIFSISAIAQNTENQMFNNNKTEVNIAVANVFAKSNYILPYYYLDGEFYYYSYYYGDYYRQPELIVGMKFHDKKGAFRLGTNLKYSTITHKYQNGSDNKYTIKYFGTTLNLGYEWHSTFNRVNIFYGFDVSSSYYGNLLRHEYTSSNSGSAVKNETETNEFAIGINPLVGVNVFITPHLSIGTEFKFIAEYVSGKSEYTSTVNPDVDESKSSGFRTRFGPLGFLSVNIHF